MRVGVPWLVVVGFSRSGGSRIPLTRATTSKRVYPRQTQSRTGCNSVEALEAEEGTREEKPPEDVREGMAPVDGTAEG